MNVLYPAPAAHLEGYVKEILVIEHDQVTGLFSLPLFANGMPTLLFSTAPAQIGSQTGHLFLFGQTVRPEQLLLRNNFKIVAYFLRPEALCGLFDVSPAELTDRPVALEGLGCQSTFEDRLLNTIDTTQVLYSIDRYLTDKITTARPVDQRICYAAGKIAATFDKNILTALQVELYMTERTFQRLFERSIGLLPNEFRRICQFNNAFRQLNGRGFRNLSTLAHHYGYADQSHFIRTFKTFTTITPSDYLAAIRNF